MHALVPVSYVYLSRRRGADDQVLLQRRSGTGYMDGHWAAGAAGHVDLGETARDAAVREAMEELGVEILREDLDLLTVMERTDGTSSPIRQRVDWFWLVRMWCGSPTIREPDKCSALAWYSLAALPRPIPPYELMVLDGFRHQALPLSTSYGFAAP